MEPLLAIDDLTVGFRQYGRENDVLHGVSLRVDPGQRVAIVGETGSGKSVTLKTVMGTLPRPPGYIRSGQIRFDGRDVHSMSARERRRLAGGAYSMVFQDPATALNPVYRIGDQLIDILRAHERRSGNRRSRSETKERAFEILREVQLTEVERVFRSYPFQLSGGMRQRVLIGMALLNRPKLLFADEPGTALDVSTQDEILHLLNDLVDHEGLTFVMITHNLGVVRMTADYVYVMRNGRIVEDGPVTQIFEAPSHEYTRNLLRVVPRLTKRPGAPLAQEPRQSSDNLVDFQKYTKIFAASRSPLRSNRKADVRGADNVNLVVRRGDVMGLAGESGSGKTTLARSVLGLYAPTSGQVMYDGRSVEDQYRSLAFKRRVQMVYQNPGTSLNPRRTVGQILQLPLRIHSLPKEQLPDRVGKMLEQVELPRGYVNKYPHELSGGQKQRVAIARSLALQPDLLILDEPTSALDVSVQERIIALLERLKQEYALTYLFISHDLALMRNFTNRVAIMSRGRIVEQGETDDVFDAPKHDYTRALLSCVPVISAEEEAAKPAIDRAKRQQILLQME